MLVAGRFPTANSVVADILRIAAQPSFAPAREAIEDDATIDDTVVVTGHAAEEIVNFARHQGYDHIVMGSRGRSLVRELLLGSVSEEVMHHAPCAVTIVR